MRRTQEPTYRYLLANFLKIGVTSFGGFMAMVSVIQDEMVTKDRVIKNDVILDGVSLASVMPGPLAVNVVTYIGYHLKGIYGALISMASVILPSFLLILGLSWIYLEFGKLPMSDKVFAGIMPSVVALIIVVAIRMARKSIGDYKQAAVCILSGLTLIIVGGFYITISLIIVGALTGVLLYNRQPSSTVDGKSGAKNPSITFPFPFFVLLCFTVLVVAISPMLASGKLSYLIASLRQIMMVFSGMSLTLFGGGYVFIPAIQETVVNNLQWLTVKEFTDCIAMGQITPGPILISATFIGYKVAGFWGSLVATISIFLPSGLLMIIGSHFLKTFKKSSIIKSAFMGLRPAVIGMIFAAAFTIGKNVELTWPPMLIFVIVLIASLKFKMNAAILIPASGALGLLLFSL